MVLGSKIIGISYDILRGINVTIVSIEDAEKASQIVKIGLSGADVVIGTSHTLEDFGCSDVFCGSLDVLGNVSSAVGLVLGNIPATKHLTLVTGSVTIGCRSVRYYCKKYGTFWGCTVTAGQEIKESIRFTIKR